VVLEWDPIQYATADVISLSLFRNNQKAGNIPRPTVMQSTKISGLAVDKEYTFHLTLRTSAGTFNSDKVTVMTHKMTDLSGITVTPGVLPAQLRESLTRAVERIGGKIADTVRIDTTHFVTVEGRGIAWEKAVEMNIPVVRPEWVEGCEASGRIVGVRQYYLDADPRQRQVLQAQPEPELARTSPQPSPRVDATTEGSNSANGDKALPQTPPAKDEPGKGEESSDEEEEEHEEEKEKEEKEVLPAEQKVRVEDRDQHKVAVRPAEPAPEPEEEKESEGDGDGEGGREEEEEKRDEEATGTLTPGNASFQDVAL
jgi:chitin biosynthesis protein CHS5